MFLFSNVSNQNHTTKTMFYDDKSAIQKIVAANILHTVSIAVNLGVVDIIKDLIMGCFKEERDIAMS